MNSHFRCSRVPGYTSEFFLKQMRIQHIKLIKLTESSKTKQDKK